MNSVQSKQPISLRLSPIPAFNDNYLWLIDNGKEAAIVDPGDANPVLDTLNKLKLKLTTILVTHHHADHIGGIDQLLEQYDANVIGPTSDKILAIKQSVSNNDNIDILGATATVIEVPGHTLDHIAYYFQSISDVSNGHCTPRLFCGDTLFAGGCGRVFEGTYEQMRHSLDKLAKLPKETQVYCAHEYTLSNLEFALAVEPENSALKLRLDAAQSLRLHNQPTVPSTLNEELKTNPFLRAAKATVAAAAHAQCNVSDDNPNAVFAAIRQWKDNF